VPGSGQFEWGGQLGRADLPRIIDPAQGFVATANEFNLPADWDHMQRPVGFEWAESARSVRIKDVLGKASRHELKDSQALQSDIFSVPAARLHRLLSEFHPHDADAKQARNMLLVWDRKMSPASGGAALFALWWSAHLRPAIVATVTAKYADLVANGHADAVLAVIETEPGKFSSVFEKTLAAAFGDARDRLGSEPASWHWGDLHQMLFQHAVFPSAHGFNVGPLPLGGDATTPMHASWRLADGRITHGASVRLVMDVGDWDKSLCINAPGQSGDPGSPHYADLAPLWAKGEYVPLLFSAAAIEAATETVIELHPADA